ncbi:MAG: glycosyltransferase family 4 protein [Oculatellaceae cyanobacterium bins.114]|nr:glycosyltransferase family 4 protein [Oculatellaceae cyanobacterium bins.114]
MKVALLHFCFEDYTIQLVNALVELIDIVLIHPEKVSMACRDALDPRVQIRSFKKPRIRDPRNIFTMMEIMQILREVQPDVLHVQETNDFWYDLTLLFNRMPPLVTTIHDVYRHPGDRQTPPGAEYTRQISFYRSQQLIVHAQTLKDVLVKQFRVPEQRIHVIAHGELGSLYQRRSHQQLVEREPHTLLFFGRIWQYKGLNYLLEAMPQVVAQIPDAKLIIAGRGEDLSYYFPNGHYPDYVELHNDFIPVEQVAQLFQRSAAAVLPYIESSQSGVAALAYGLGTPVIASDIGGLREIIRHKEDGLLVAPGNSQALSNAIVHFLSSQSLQSQMQISALERCKHDLSWLKIASQTISIYCQTSKT